MERLNKAQYRFTECGKIRSQVRQLDEDDRADLHRELKKLLLQSNYGDLAGYITEIFSSYKELGKK